MKIEVFWKQMLQLLSLGLAFWLGTQWFALRWIFLGGQTNPVTTGINNVEDYPASISTSPVGNNKNKSPIQQYQNCNTKTASH